ncbi:MAG: oligoribonuclease [Candidatus Saccharibacteria bacterium]
MNKKLANAKINRVLWLDLEMTGLSPENDLILEVAILATDWDFSEIDSYQGVIRNKEPLLKKRIAANAVFWDANPDSRDGLMSQNNSGQTLAQVEDDILRFIDKNFDADVPVLLAGNSIHIDRQFIRANWPKFDSKLHYRMLDVSAWKVVFDGKYGKKFAKPDAHRALDDIRGSIVELQYYLAKLN